MTKEATNIASDTNAQVGTSRKTAKKASRKATSMPVATRAKRGGVGGNTRKKKSASKKTEQLTKEALKVTEENLAAIDGEERAAVRKKAVSKKTSQREKPTSKSEGKTSALDAAVIVLKKAKPPMRCHKMVEAMFAQKLWASDGQTPHATLYSAILREIQKKGKESRFEKVDRGRFQLRKA